MTPDPSLAEALTAATEAGNVTGKLMWLAAQITSPEMCYLPDGFALIDLAAASSPSEVLAVERKLAAKFGKDWKVSTFRSNVKESKSRLTIPASADTPLITSAAGVPKPLLANAILKLSTIVDIGFDSFSSEITYKTPSPWGTEGPWEDRDDHEAANRLQVQGIECGSNIAHDAAFVIAKRNSFHPVRDWLTQLGDSAPADGGWDGVERLPNLMHEYFKTKDGIYASEIGKMWPISCVARIIEPGCQSKYMIVLEGLQDEGKSKALRALTNGHTHGLRGRQWFRDRPPRINNDQNIGQYMQGVWVIEIAELAAFQRNEQEEIKALISSQVDIFRSPYGRNQQRYPRQCVFAATVNVNRDSTPDWGKDPTGLVRFWPIRTGHPDVEAIMRDYTQIWAEAVHRYRAGEKWWGEDGFAELARAEQDQRVPDVTVHREEIVAALLKISGEIGFDGWVNVGQILSATSIPVSGHERLKRDVGAILRQEGWKHGSHRFNGGNAHPSQGFRKEEE